MNHFVQTLEYLCHHFSVPQMFKTRVKNHEYKCSVFVVWGTAVWGTAQRTQQPSPHPTPGHTRTRIQVLVLSLTLGKLPHHQNFSFLSCELGPTIVRLESFADVCMYGPWPCTQRLVSPQ